MKKALIVACVAGLVLTGCSEAEDRRESGGDAMAAAAESTTTDAAEVALGEEIAPAPIPAAMPQLAYAYGLAFSLAGDDVGKLMRRHAEICEHQGPQSCRIVGMELSGEANSDAVSGTLQLAVAARHARALSALLEDEAADAGAEQTETTIGSEEVSKTIVDTEARIRSREQLRDRLLEVLRTRRGSVEDLVEAERQVAAVNEEIDQARSWLAETEGRVAFSRMDVVYASDPGPGGSFTAPIAAVLGSLGTILGVVIAGLLLIGALLAPIAGLVWAGRAINRRMTPASDG